MRYLSTMAMGFGTLAGASAAFSAVDSVQTVYKITPTSGVTALDSSNINTVVGQEQGIGYNPVTDTLYVATAGAFQGLYQVANVSTAPVSTRLETPTQYQSFTNNKQPLPFGMTLNPVAFNGKAAYTTAYLVDGSTVAAANDFTTAKRVYSWNLQNETAIDGSSTTLSNGLTAQQILTAAGATGSGNPLATIRRVAYGNDGKSLYFAANGSNAFGVFRYDVSAGTVSKISTNANSAFATQEVGVQQISATTDRVLYTDSTNNVLYQDVNTTTGVAAAPQTLIAASTITGFVNASTAETPESFTTDSAGNIYFQVGTAAQTRNVILRYDPQGRLAKVATIAELKSVQVNQGAVLNSTAIYPGTYTSAAGTINVNQLWFGNNSTTDPFVGKINLFQPGDFNRDGVVNAADGAVLAASGAIKPVGTTTTDTSLFKFDLNGDSPQSVATPTTVVDFNDVKVFQKFLPFADGDTDFNLSLDLSDLKTIEANYGATGTVWTQGDFNGDNLVNAADLAIIANSWLNVLHQPNLTDAQLSQFPTGQFLTDVETAFSVPEPAGLAAAAVVAAGFLRRRRAGLV